jgi:hypothetical protein
MFSDQERCTGSRALYAKREKTRYKAKIPRARKLVKSK